MDVSPLAPRSLSSLFSPQTGSPARLSSLFAQQPASRTTLSSLFSLREPPPSPFPAPAPGAPGADAFARSLHERSQSAQSNLLNLAVGGTISPAAGSLIDLLAKLNGAAPITPFPNPAGPAPGVSTAAADILSAFYQPQFDLIGDVIDSFG